MVSKTKYGIDNLTLKNLYHAAGIEHITDITPLGAGEYNAVFCAKADGKEYVLKIAPPEKTPVLTYEKKMMTSEVFWYQQIRAHTSITVPELYFIDFEKKRIPTDYFIMQKLPGKTLDQMKLTKQEKEEAVRETAQMAAQIHKIKNQQFGYLQNQLYDNWYQAVRSFFETLIQDCAKAGKKTKRGQKMLTLIDRHKAVLEQAPCSMVNFDIGEPNIMCQRVHDQLQFAWIDPERSFWGDRIVDFVCLEIMLPLAKKTRSLSAYNAVADKPVEATPDEQIRFAVAQAYMALIMETEKYYRYTPRHFGWWRNVAASCYLYQKAFACL